MEAVRFESAAQINAARNSKREAQDRILKKAEEDFYKHEAKKERSKLNTWMLPSVSAQIQRNDNSLSSSKEKKKKKKKHKKDKKKIKHKDNSPISDSSDSEKSEVDTWVEKDSTMPTVVAAASDASVKLQRDSWMNLPSSFVPTLSKEEIKQKEKRCLGLSEDDNTNKLSLDKPGQHERELNPYWKDGGMGLPTEISDSPMKSVNQLGSVGDGGLTWLKKAYHNAIEQAKEENRTLEEVAAERWGSLENLESMLNNAMKKSKANLSVPDQHSCDRRRRDEYSSSRLSRSPFSDQKTTSKHRYDYAAGSGSSKLHRNYSELETRIKRETYRKSTEAEEKNETSASTSSFVTSSYAKASTPKFVRPADDDEPASVTRSITGSISTTRRPKWKKDVPVSSIAENDRGVSVKTETLDQNKSDVKSNTDEKVKMGSAPRACSPVEHLTDKEMNELGAKMLKAELMGDNEMLAKLKAKLEAARELRKTEPKGSPGSSSVGEEKVVVLTRTNNRGLTRPLLESEKHGSAPQGRRRKEAVKTHDEGGKRTKYFADDDQYSLKQMFEREKLGTAEDQNAMFARLAAKGLDSTSADYDMDDAFVSRASQKSNAAKMDAQERLYAINDYKRSNAAMEKCHYCIDSKNLKKHLIIALGIKTYLCLPPFHSLTEGHCLILPMQHVTASTFLDEDVWSEIQIFRKGLTKMFEDKQQDVVFFETCMNIKYYPHMVLQCVPLSKEEGSLAPMYFKKAILESETEWAQNKKLVDLNGRDVRKAIPKGLPYFSVNFGLEGGFAHVIEDEQLFPKYFAQEIIGGMLDLDPTAWRRPPRETFDEQCKKVLQFADWWKPYDWTHRLKE